MTPSGRLGRYELIGVIGEGGMGRVYEAVLCGPAGFRKRVALKVLRGSGEGLVREARLAGLLRHPNLVDVYELGEADGVWYCAMELVSGGTIRRRIPLAPLAVVEVGLQVCAGLASAWRQVGLVHLDLKPANLLLEGSLVKVADLGIAMARGFDQDAQIRGTRGYMSPEQLRGGPVDTRSDVYSLGVVLVQLATGARPTQNADTFDFSDAPPGPSAPREVAPWLAPVVRRCLEPDPRDRFPDMVALSQALAALEVDGPGLAMTLGEATPMPGIRREALVTAPLQSTGVARTNLGPEPDTFVGRARELGEIAELLTATPLVTLKGAGGMGKTRLARQLGRIWLAEPGCQAWFCDLSAARTAADLVGAVAGALGIGLAGGDASARAGQVGRALAGRSSVLLILDNFDQLVAHGPLVGAWVAEAPHLRVLVTSRQPLERVGERVVELEPLVQADAVGLLTERAAARGVSLDADSDLVELARQLDGLPLALELAAARLSVLSPRQILDRLDERLRLLDGGRGAATTLRATLDGSWDLLDDWQRDTLAQLAVFAGGFTLEAAEEVVVLPPAAPWVLDVVDALVARSLVAHRQAEGSPRFHLYEAVRAYAAERGGDQRAAADRHAATYAALGSLASLAGLERHGGAVHRLELRRELANLLAACRHASAPGGDGAHAAGAALAAARVLTLDGTLETADEALHGVLERVPEAPRRSELLAMLGEVRSRAGDFPSAEQLLGEAMDLAPTADRKARVLGKLGTFLFQRGDLSGAIDTLGDALQQLEKEGDGVHLGLVHGTLAAALRMVGRTDEARLHFEEALRICAETGSRAAEGVVRGNYGLFLMHSGDLDSARAVLEGALLAHRDVGNRRSEGISLGILGSLHLRAGRADEALAFYAAAMARALEMGDTRQVLSLRTNLAVVKLEQRQLETAVAELQEALAAAEALGDGGSRASLLLNLGIARQEQGDLQASARLLHDARACFCELGRKPDEGVTCEVLAGVLMDLGELEAARERSDEALELLRQCGSPWLAVAEGGRAALEFETGQFAAARERLDRALALEDPIAGKNTVLLRARRARCRMHLGDPAGAAEDLAAAVALETDDDGVLAQLACAHADVAALAGRDPGPWLDEAEERAARWGARPGSPVDRVLQDARRRTAEPGHPP